MNKEIFFSTENPYGKISEAALLDSKDLTKFLTLFKNKAVRDI